MESLKQMEIFNVLYFCCAISLVSAGNYQNYQISSLGDVYGIGNAVNLNTGVVNAKETRLLTSLGNGFKTGLGGGLNLGFALPVAMVSGPGIDYSSIMPSSTHTTAAVQTRRTYEIVRLSLPRDQKYPQVVEVEPSEQPVQVIFRTSSSPVTVQQFHTPGNPGKTESTRSEDEPQRVTHEVLRPVIQEVREVIQPYRTIVQEIRPVREEVHTLVAKGKKYRDDYREPYEDEGAPYLSGRTPAGFSFGSGFKSAVNTSYKKVKVYKGGRAAKGRARA